MRKSHLAAAVILVLGLAVATFAATQYTTSKVNVNIGSPGEATFYFQQTPGVYVGSDALIFQCGFSRAQWIGHVGIYNEQQASQFFNVSCTSGVSKNTIGQRVISYTVHTPFTVTLEPQGYQLTVNSASWQSTEMGCGRSGSDCFKDGAGTATVSY